jgi:uncharacterized protein (DUF1499 family)
MKLPRFALALAAIAAIMLLASGVGTRLSLWDFRTGFGVLRWAAFVGLAAAVCAVVMLLLPRLRRAHGVMLAVALLLGLGVAFVPWNNLRIAKTVPPIHDISTDTTNPPTFVAILPLRANAANSADYGGAEIARQQLAAYPDVRPLQLAMAPAQAFDRALGAARAMGWEIVASDPAAGRIEATATTLWFGFKDDVVIRVQASDKGSRIDVRSVSRVGMSDVGQRGGGNLTWSTPASAAEKRFQRNAALIASSVAEPGQSSRSPKVLKATAVVSRCACRSAASGSTYSNPVTISPRALQACR